MNIGFNATALIPGLSSSSGAGKGHPFELRAGPFFGGELQVVSLRGRERINDVYRYEVTFATDLPPELIVSVLFGMPACLTIKVPGPGTDPRIVQGIASSVEALGGVPGEQGSKRRRFRLEIVPRLWLLQHKRQNRIFQNESIPYIVQVVLDSVGIKDADCKWRADRKSYPALPFVYQRDETDWEFFRRILASAGIFFYYVHATGFLDSMFAGASAIAGAAGAAAGMIGGAVGSVVSTVESMAGMVPVLNFGDTAGHTAAVSAALDIGAGLSALAGTVGAPAVAGIAGILEEPSDTLPFDDGMGADTDYERVFEFAFKKEIHAKELRMLDRDVEVHRTWVGVTTSPDVTGSLDVSAGLSLGSGLTASANLAASFDIDAPTIPASMLRQEVYNVDPNFWQDGAATGPKAGPAVSLSAGLSAGPGGLLATAQAAAGAGPASAMLATYRQDAATAKRMGMELDRVRRKYQRAVGRSDCRRLGAGYRFTLGKHPISMVNGEYTVTALDVEGTHPDFLGDDEAVYRNRFRCVPSRVAPRPKRPARRPKPGLEVARVVGFIGAEKLPGLEASTCGYVKVRFRWDVVDDSGTPHGSLKPGVEDAYVVWLPVVQPWAGSGYGAQFIPREGMEVLVGFMEDQSERPVILGCLYSTTNPPPWPAYVDHQKVGIRSQTRSANGGFSEMSIDDRRDGEVVRFRAQKDLVEDVLNDRTATIGHDTTTTVGNDASRTVGANDVLVVGADRHVTVGATRRWRVKGDAHDTIEGMRKEHVGNDEALVVKGAQSSFVAKSRTDFIGNTLRVTVGEDQQTVVGGVARSVVQKNAFAHVVGHYRVQVDAQGDAGTGLAGASLKVRGDYTVHSAEKTVVRSDKSLRLECGENSIELTPDGIVLRGKTVSIVGQGKAQLAAKGSSLVLDGDANLVGGDVNVCSSGATVQLDSNATVKGASVRLGSGSGDQTSSDKVQAKEDKVPVKVRAVDSQGKVLSGKSYRLTVEGKSLSGTTDGAGMVDQQVPKAAEQAELEISGVDSVEGGLFRVSLLLGGLPPVDEVRGVQARLNNLGYHCPVNGDVDIETREVLRQFQQDEGLTVTGDIDGATRRTLKTLCA